MIYSQRNPEYCEKVLPNAGNSFCTIKNIGCLLSCLANLVQIPPDKIMEANPGNFNPGGYMQTDVLYGKYGYKIRKVSHPVGTPLPKSDTPYIAVTSFFARMNPAWKTHFYLAGYPDGSIIDTASISPLKTVNRYAETTFEIRHVEKVQSVNPQKCQVCGK